MDLAQATGVPEAVTLGGKDYEVRLLNYREQGVLMAFVKREAPSPITRVGMAIQQAKEAGCPLDLALEDRMQTRAEAAATRWPPRFGSEAWFDALFAIDGGDAKLLHEVLSKTDPAFTTEKAAALAPRLSNAEWGDLVRVAFWGGPPRPKGDEPPPPATPP